jgi:hypothetical protein
VVVVVGSGGDVVVVVPGDAQRLSNCSSMLHGVVVVVVWSADCFAAASWRAGRCGSPLVGPSALSPGVVRAEDARLLPLGNQRFRESCDLFVRPVARLPPGQDRWQSSCHLGMDRPARVGTPAPFRPTARSVRRGSEGPRSLIRGFFGTGGDGTGFLP